MVGVTVAVAVAVRVGVHVTVAVRVGVAVGVAVRVMVGIVVGVAVRVEVGVAVGVDVGGRGAPGPIRRIVPKPSPPIVLLPCQTRKLSQLPPSSSSCRPMLKARAVSTAKGVLFPYRWLAGMRTSTFQPPATGRAIAWIGGLAWPKPVTLIAPIGSAGQTGS